MTTWSEYKTRRPLKGEAARAYERERARMGVGYLILKARAKVNLTQAQLARKIGSTQPMIARWESGAQVPNLNTLIRIAKATGYDLAVGLHDRKASGGRLDALAYIESAGRSAELQIVREAAPTYGLRSAARKSRKAAHHGQAKPKRR